MDRDAARLAPGACATCRGLGFFIAHASLYSRMALGYQGRR